jgi:hypothetical protein
MPRFSGWDVATALLALCLSFGIAAQSAPQATTSVTIAGNVAQSLSLTVADLRRYHAYQFDYGSRIIHPALARGTRAGRRKPALGA